MGELVEYTFPLISMGGVGLTVSLIPVRRGCYFSHLSCLYCCTTVRLIIKALLTTTLGVVSLLQETEPLLMDPQPGAALLL